MSRFGDWRVTTLRTSCALDPDRTIRDLTVGATSCRPSGPGIASTRDLRPGALDLLPTRHHAIGQRSTIIIRYVAKAHLGQMAAPRHVLTVNHIPQYEGEPEDWDRFLYKAAKGSAKATDILADANMAYMVALTGDPTSPETLQFSKYNAKLRDYFSTLDRPTSAHHLAQTIDDSNWFVMKLHGQLSTPKQLESYSAIWARGRTVSERDLLNDSIHHCHSSWSADWLLQVIDDETCLEYNSVNVVAAMLLLAVTWKVT